MVHCHCDCTRVSLCNLAYHYSLAVIILVGYGNITSIGEDWVEYRVKTVDDVVVIDAYCPWRGNIPYGAACKQKTKPLCV
jgi:hypothetical protein